MTIDIVFTVGTGIALLSAIVAVLNLVTAGISIAAALIKQRDAVQTKRRGRH